MKKNNRTINSKELWKTSDSLTYEARLEDFTFIAGLSLPRSVNCVLLRNIGSLESLRSSDVMSVMVSGCKFALMEVGVTLHPVFWSSDLKLFESLVLLRPSWVSFTFLVFSLDSGMLFFPSTRPAVLYEINKCYIIYYTVSYLQ